jgi:hypothetical protein
MQLFSNNVDTTLAAPLSSSATTATLADGSRLNSPVPHEWRTELDEYELLTLTAVGNVEIVRVTGRTGNVVAIERAQEGTTAQSWPAGTRVVASATAGTYATFLRSETQQENSLALNGAEVWEAHSLGIGQETVVRETDGIAIGRGSEVFGVGSIALGPEVQVFTDHSAQFGALAIVGANEDTLSSAEMSWRNSGPSVVCITNEIVMTATGTVTIAMPTDIVFFPDEAGVIVTLAWEITGQPTIRLGTGAEGEEAVYLTATQTTGLAAHYDRQQFDLLSGKGSSVLRAEITIAGTAGTFKGRIYWRGFAMLKAV